MNKQDRNGFIDTVRGVSILAMILIHSCSYFLQNKIASFLWNYSQFAVAGFIFCSAYIFFSKPFIFNRNFVFSYLKKRITRLLIPYYIFLTTYLLLLFFKNPKIITPNYIISNLFLLGGVDLNWIILLFVQLLLVSVFIGFVMEKRKVFFYIYFLFSFLVSIILLFLPVSINYRFIMWIPWSLIVFFAILAVKNEKKKLFFPQVLIGLFIIYVACRLLLVAQNKTIIQFGNKYPPNLYHLVYGIFCIALIYILYKRGVFSFKPITKVMFFFSINSYSIFFIHFIIIFIINYFFKSLMAGWGSFFGIVLFSTIIVQLGINKLKINKMF